MGFGARITIIWMHTKNLPMRHCSYKPAELVTALLVNGVDGDSKQAASLPKP